MLKVFFKVLNRDEIKGAAKALKSGTHDKKKFDFDV